MIRPVDAREAAQDRRALELDVQIALRVDGFRWVCWLDGESPEPPRESGGRFLARRDDRLARVQRAASLSMPLAPQPYRHLPRYSLDAGLALALCDRIGLFREGGIVVRQRGDGRWVLGCSGRDDEICDASLPSLLTRAALRRHAHAASCRQALQ